MKQIKYQFRFPKNKYGLNEVCYNIIDELYRRNWNVPGFKTQFTYDQNKTAEVWSIEISNDGVISKLEFRGGREVGYVNSMTFVKEGVYKGFSKYDDGSGHLYVYRGEDKELQHAIATNSYFPRNKSVDDYKLWSGMYKGSEYKSPLEPISYYDVEKEAIKFLSETILPMFKDVPIPPLDLDYLIHPYIPIPDNIPDFFMVVNRRSQQRIENYDSLEGDDQYAVYHSCDWVTAEDGKFTWSDYSYRKLGVGNVDSAKSYKDYNIPGTFNWDDKCVVRVNLKNAFGISVIDHQAYLDKREELKDRTAEPRFNDSEIKEMETTEKKTRIPITDDRWRQYKSPIILVSREIRREEVEIAIPYKK